MVFLSGIISIEGKEDEKKAPVVDWEKNNFGIRNFHSQADVLNTVNIDKHAPDIPKRMNKSRHKPKRKSTKPPIIHNKLKIRGRHEVKQKEEKELESDIKKSSKGTGRYLQRSKTSIRTSRRNIGKNISMTTKKTKVQATKPNLRRKEGSFKSAHQRSLRGMRLRSSTQTPLIAEKNPNELN